MWHSLQVSSNSDFVAASKAAGVGGLATLRAGAGRADGTAGGAAGAETDLEACAVAPCSDDLMFTARIKAMDATPIAHT